MKHCFATPLKLPCPNLVNSYKAISLICSIRFIHNYLKNIYSMSNISFCLSWLLKSCIPVILLNTPSSLFFSFWNITVLWSNTTQFVKTHICVIFSRRNMSLSISSTVQLHIVRYWKYSTNLLSWTLPLAVKNVVIICQTLN